MTLRISSSDLPTRSFAFAKPSMSGIVSRSQTNTCSDNRRFPRMSFDRLLTEAGSVNSCFRPHFVRAIPSGRSVIFNRPRGNLSIALMINILDVCGHGWIHFARCGKVHPEFAYNGSDTSGLRTHSRGWDRRCGLPPLLSACTRKTISGKKSGRFHRSSTV